jgi:ribose transport system ATP-binding protein
MEPIDRSNSTFLTSEAVTLLEMRAITKRFPGVLALDNVSFEVRRGEVHALLGENGAGKSTLMKILSGVYEKDGGEVIFKGKPVTFSTPRQAQLAGIKTIYQELNLVPQLSITENIFLGDEIERGVLLNWPEMHRRARELLAKIHLDIDPTRTVASLGVAQQQMVEVAKALHQKAELIIMDEPTSALSLNEINDLFAIIRELKAQNVGIIFISHHLDEAFVICDRITVLRDGHNVATKQASELDVDMLIRMMVGRSLTEQFPKESVPRGAEVLRVEGLTSPLLNNVSFTAYGGEVLGIAGLVGAGRTELVRAIFGADPVTSGEIYVDGKRAKIRSPRDAIRHGIGLLPEDRKQQGLVLQLSVRENITMAVLERLTMSAFTNQRKEATISEQYIESLAIKTPSLKQLVINLSGGTQQKVVLSKWMAIGPRVLIFDEPTRGIDVGAKVEIYKLMNQLARQGMAILMISSELPEILGMSDQIMVISNKRVAGFLNRDEATQEKIMELATSELVSEKKSDLQHESSNAELARNNEL